MTATIATVKNSYQVEGAARREADRVNEYAAKLRAAGQIKPRYSNARVEHDPDSVIAVRTLDNKPGEMPWFPWRVIVDERRDDR